MDIGSLLYYGGLALWSAFIAYTLLFSFGKPAPHQEAPPASSAPASRHAPAEPVVPRSATSEKLSQEGFKAFQQGPELTVDDIVKGLSRE